MGSSVIRLFRTGQLVLMYVAVAPESAIIVGGPILVSVKLLFKLFETSSFGSPRSYALGPRGGRPDVPQLI